MNHAPDTRSELAEFQRDWDHIDLTKVGNIHRARDVIADCRSSILPSMLQGADRAALIDALDRADAVLERRLQD